MSALAIGLLLGAGGMPAGMLTSRMDQLTGARP